MKHIKLIGLISSVLLIINYLIIGPLVAIGLKDYWFNKYLLTHDTFVFSIAFISFYFALFLQLKDIRTIKLKTPLAIILGLGIIKFFIGIIGLTGFYYLPIFSSVISFATMIVFIIWAISVIRNMDIQFKRIRTFAITMLAGHIFIFLFAISNLVFREFLYTNGSQPFEFINYAYTVYGIGYLTGLFIFIEMKNTSS